jgi:hypothetical protein
MKPDHDSRGRQARLTLIIVIVGVWVASVAYRVLAWRQLEHTALVFIGIPAILAIAVALMPAPKTVTGLILKAMTLSLLLSGVLFGEAFVCILFAAPLFLLVGTLIGFVVDYRRSRTSGVDFKALTLLSLAIMPLSLEGVLPGFEFNREEHVTASRVVAASVSDVSSALAQTPQFDRRLPLFLRLGFPTPGATSGAGLEEGDLRQIEFIHGHHPGVLTLAVQTSTPGHLVFGIRADDSYLTHWLTWRRAEVRWREIAPGRTEVSWTLIYRRRLDPAWYFTPLERHGASLAAGYLIDTIATPRSR